MFTVVRRAVRMSEVWLDIITVSVIFPEGILCDQLTADQELRR